jgi:hypothetical protein
MKKRYALFVTAVIELLARFDETSNIYWTQKMQEAGISVILGIEGLKIHSKLTLVKGTGNNKINTEGIPFRSQEELYKYYQAYSSINRKL